MSFKFTEHETSTVHSNRHPKTFKALTWLKAHWRMKVQLSQSSSKKVNSQRLHKIPDPGGVTTVFPVSSALNVWLSPASSHKASQARSSLYSCRTFRGHGEPGEESFSAYFGISIFLLCGTGTISTGPFSTRHPFSWLEVLGCSPTETWGFWIEMYPSQCMSLESARAHIICPSAVTAQHLLWPNHVS